jgi:RNA polymerase sigma factor (sigma-70 family)
MQEGMLALLQAYDSFDPSYGVQLTTYAYVIISNSLHRYARNEKLYRYDLPFEDGYVAVDTDAEQQVIMEELISLMKEDANRSILLDYFVNGHTQAEVASRNFCTQQRVSQVVTEFRKRVVDLWN